MQTVHCFPCPKSIGCNLCYKTPCILTWNHPDGLFYNVPKDVNQCFVYSGSRLSFSCEIIYGYSMQIIAKKGEKKVIEYANQFSGMAKNKTTG